MPYYVVGQLLCLRVEHLVLIDPFKLQPCDAAYDQYGRVAAVNSRSCGDEFRYCIIMYSLRLPFAAAAASAAAHARHTRVMIVHSL